MNKLKYFDKTSQQWVPFSADDVQTFGGKTYEQFSSDLSQELMQDLSQQLTDIEVDLSGGLSARVDGVETRLSEKAQQVDLNNTNINVALKADKTTTDNLQTQILSIASGAPKAVSLVSQMTDTTKNYVYTGSEGGYTAGNWYYYNGSAWVSGGVYQSTGLADLSIAPKKTTFIRDSKNLFDKSTVEIGALNLTTGAVDSANTAWFTSAYIPIEAGLTLKKSHISSTVQYDVNKNLLNSTSNNANSFVTPSNAKFIRVSVRNYELDIYQLELGATTTEYESYGLKMPAAKITDDSSISVFSEKRTSSLYPYNSDYPDTIYDIMTTTGAISGVNTAIAKDYKNAWRNKEFGYKLTTIGAVSAQFINAFTASVNIPYAQAVGMLVYMENPELVTSVVLDLGHQSTGYQWNRSKTTFKKGWNLLRWKALASTYGTWKDFYRYRVSFVTTAATSITVGSIFLEQTAKAKLLFVNDGGYKTFLLNGYPALKSRGIPTTWALAPGRFGYNGLYITEAELDTIIYDYMSAFSFHSWNAEVHSTATTEEVANIATKCMRWLQAKGIQPKYWFRGAITQNDCPNHAVLQNMVEAYSSPTASSSTEIFPFELPYGFPRITLHGQTQVDMDTLFAQLKISHGLVVVYTHGIGLNLSTGLQDSTDMTTDNWNYFLSKLDTALAEGWIEGVTYDMLRNRYSKPSLGWGIENLINKI